MSVVLFFILYFKQYVIARFHSFAFTHNIYYVYTAELSKVIGATDPNKPYYLLYSPFEQGKFLEIYSK